jgi:DNA end-binding protein Ku
MAGTSRSLWNGAINFGLVHIPVSLHPATAEHAIDFDWLDKRTMDPVGYKRVNKRTGKEIDKDDIVKGVAIEDDHYVVLSDAEISAAYPRATQSIDIEAFVAAAEIPFVLLDRPYYLAPSGKGEKVYVLLRETLAKARRIGIARVVIQTRQHLAALVPAGPALVLNLLRWGADVRSWTDMNLPATGSKAARPTERELAMAAQLVEDMTTRFDPAAYRDSFKDEVMALVRRKAAAGGAEVVEAVEAPPANSAEIIDLSELLKRSLRGDTGARATKSRSAAVRHPSLPRKRRRA